MVKDLYNLEDVLNYQINKVKKKSPLPYKELYQIAYMGYLRAKENCDPTYEKIPLKYASQYIRRELLNALYSEWNYNNKKSLPYGETDVVEYLENRSDDKDVNITTDERLNKIKYLLLEIPDEYREIIYDTYFAKKPKRLIDIAEKKNVSKQRIQQMKYKGLDMLSLLWEEKYGKI